MIRPATAADAALVAAPDRLTLLIESQGRAAGFTQLRWDIPPTGVSGTSPGEIQRFYLRRAFHGAGLAAALMSACLEALGARGSDVAWLGVWKENPRAIAFYRKQGFVEVGRKVFMVGTDPVRMGLSPVAGRRACGRSRQGHGASVR